MGWILAVTGQTAAQNGNAAANGFVTFLPMIILLVVFWFLVFVPQRKQQKQRNEMIGNLKKGDKVVTIGGIHGEIVDFDDDDVKLRVADKVEIKFTKSAISKVKK
jgi:preprotein translocase subunit YajC